MSETFNANSYGEIIHPTNDAFSLDIRILVANDTSGNYYCQNITAKICSCPLNDDVCNLTACVEVLTKPNDSISFSCLRGYLNKLDLWQET